MNQIQEILIPTEKISRDMLVAMKQEGGGVTNSEARYLVDLYYTMQDQRVRINNQAKGLDRDAKKTGTEAEPHAVIDFVMAQFAILEKNVSSALCAYIQTHEMAWFFDQTIGIGPILAAGLLAHIDIDKAPTAGHIWRFAGLDPTMTWEKKTKRPWNAELKKLCWKIGDSFVKFSNHDQGHYGKIYRERKAYEWQRNLTGANADSAQKALSAKKFKPETDARKWYEGDCDPERARALLEEGNPPTASSCKSTSGPGVPMLPPAHIDMRARRYAVKLFLSHLHECWWTKTHGEAPPKPFAIAILNHAHYLAPFQSEMKAAND
jgi:hypothetical protein